MVKTDCIEKTLKGKDSHVHNILVFSSKLKDINYLVDNCLFEVFILTKFLFKQNLDNPYKLHQLVLLMNLVGQVLHRWKLQIKCLEKTNGEVRLLYLVVLLQL